MSVFTSRFANDEPADVIFLRQQRDEALTENEAGYDDEVVSSCFYDSASTMQRFHVVITRHGRTYSRIVGSMADWIECAPPIPHTETRRLYNNVRIASAEVVDAKERNKQRRSL